MTRRQYLERVALVIGLAALAPIRVSVARQPFDELCDENGDCLVSENGARLICE
jgi:hypothetical protein